MGFAFFPGRGIQMKKYVQRLVLGLAIGAQFLAYQNCSKVDASDVTDDGASAIIQNTPDNPDPGPTCTNGKDITKPTKIFLVVDASLSNITASDPTDPTNPNKNWIGSDDNKVWRSKVLNAVIAKYGNNPHISFGLVSFQGNDGAAQPITAHIHAPGSNEPIFTNDMAAVRAGVDDFMKVVEGSGTPTPSAVQKTGAVIKADMDAHPGENATYQIILMTDGQPSARRYDVQRGKATAINNATLDTQAVMAVNPDMIHFNGVFYYNDDAAVNNDDNTVILKKIVEVGKGIYLTANTLPNYDFNIDTVLKFEPSQCE
jgi:hypothetical protein